VVPTRRVPYSLLQVEISVAYSDISSSLEYEEALAPKIMFKAISILKTRRPGTTANVVPASWVLRGTRETFQKGIQSRIDRRPKKLHARR
jgi:hypothetical protein